MPSDAMPLVLSPWQFDIMMRFYPHWTRAEMIAMLHDIGIEVEPPLPPQVDGCSIGCRHDKNKEIAVMAAHRKEGWKHYVHTAAQGAGVAVTAAIGLAVAGVVITGLLWVIVKIAENI